MSLIFDIETGPLPDEELKSFFEFDPAKVPGADLIGQEFDPSTVKFGNTKDEAKRAAKVEEEQAKFEQAQAAAIKAMESGESVQFAELKDKAALYPITGRVLAIGFYSVTKDVVKIAEGDESEILTTFWRQFTAMKKANRSIVGHNIFGFDLPFLIRRSWVHSVDIPRAVYQLSGRYVNWDKSFLDTMLAWQLGQFGGISASLDAVAKCFGHPGKPDDVGGGDFARLYFGTAEERAKAIDYLKNDLVMMAMVAERLGLVEGVKPVEEAKVNGEVVGVG